MAHDFWLLSRAAGLEAYVLLFAATLAGIATSTRLAARLRRAHLAFEVHRTLVWMAVAATALHVAALAGNRYAALTPAQLVVPFIAPSRPVAAPLGILSLYALLVLASSFYVRRRIGTRTWRALHYTTFAMFVGVSAHALVAGPDAGNIVVRGLYAGALAAVALGAAYRLFAPPLPLRARAPERGRGPAPVSFSADEAERRRAA